MSKYRVLQLTNEATEAVEVNGYMPLGKVTRRISSSNACVCGENTFEVSTTGANVVTLNEAGYYRISYTATVASGAVGEVKQVLTANGVSVQTMSASASAVGDDVGLMCIYMIRVLPNCNSVTNNVPMNIQIQNTGVEITGGTTNLLIERVY